MKPNRLRKPCPFCASHRTEMQVVPHDGVNGYMIACRGCTAAGPVCASPEQAELRWKTRRKPRTKR